MTSTCALGNDRKPTARLPALGALALATASAWGQGSPVSIVPTVTISQSITDNRDLGSVAKQSDSITQISPGVRVTSRSGRLRGTLDYALNALAYARDSQRNDVQHALSAAFTAEAIERHAYVDVRASIAQQSISAFGVQSAGNTSVNPNSTEVRSTTVSPVLRGSLGDLANLEARLSLGKTSTAAATNAESSNRISSVRAVGGRGHFGWSADASRSVTDYSAGRETTVDRFGLNLNYSPDPDWRLAARVGREKNDVLAVQTETTSSYGLGVQWTPSPRTTLGFDIDRRFFGNAHSFALQHRMRRMIIRLSDTRDSYSGQLGGIDSNIIDAYDQLFPQLAAQIPDPVARDLYVRALLARQGGFLNSAVSLQRRQEASIGWTGLRASLVASASQSDAQRLDRVSSASDDLSLVGRVRQHGYGLSFSYRLSAQTSAALGYNQISTAAAGSQPGSDQRSINLSLSTQIDRRAAVSLLVRHVNYDTTIRPYTENAATATLSLRF